MRAALLAGGLGLATFIGALFAYNSRKTVTKIPRQKILQTAKLLRQHMFMTLVQIAAFVKQNASKFPPDQLRQYVLSEDNSYMQNIRNKLKQVFKQFTEQQFQENIEIYYKKDMEVQYHLKKYQQEFEKAILGVTPQFREQVVTFVDCQKLLKITKQLLEAKLQNWQQKVNEKMTNQQMVNILKAQRQQQKALRSQKLQALGFVGKDQELASIYEFSVAKFIKIDNQFERAYRSLIQQYKMKYQEHVDRFCNFPRSESRRNITQK